MSINKRACFPDQAQKILSQQDSKTPGKSPRRVKPAKSSEEQGSPQEKENISSDNPGKGRQVGRRRSRRQGGFLKKLSLFL